ncbi:MGMT family protein [Deinococcus maricopensis]|uniref:Methylated-DNA-(Protein)-cysteine S-methyltransferase DNA binding protein n=1 Tax=Deinococcus maricopensis (strain DSM 21211 / LMG 22137 / NRRL B-23946 / LB-34) TaxID=709986 RepID=E8UBC5_DEIML|nr:MGMT family protein [Deinococcus maricopensis]ADV68364.1 Methylated-DNA-(protein)-cysteine S-methyltransferase DNA binding protein [Deinococcus maricopensis DSM 21211]
MKASGDAFRARVLAAVQGIPSGRVMTYGSVAVLAGHPGAARQVGFVLRGLPDAADADVPWQRVVNASGGISTYRVGAGELQRALLEAEGVAFSAAGRCDLRVYGWWPPDAPG